MSEKQMVPNKGPWSVLELAKIGMVTALYVVVTLSLSVISFGVVQIRLSEMFNYLGLFHKRYIVAVTLGVAIANVFSPLGIVDVVIGSLSTYIVLRINVMLTKRIKSLPIKMMVTACVTSISMFTVAGELSFFYHMPFFSTWLIVGLGELVSMTVGGGIMYVIHKKIDLYQ